MSGCSGTAAGSVARRLPEGRLARGGKLGALAAKQAVRGGRTRLSMVGRSERAKELLAERATIEMAENLVTVLGSMKGAAMKLGQMLSVIELDLVPDPGLTGVLLARLVSMEVARQDRH